MQPAQEPLVELEPQKIFFLLLPLVCFSQLLPCQKLVLALEIYQAVPAAEEVSCFQAEKLWAEKLWALSGTAVQQAMPRWSRQLYYYLSEDLRSEAQQGAACSTLLILPKCSSLSIG